MENIFMEKWAKKFRTVIIALIFSGALNIGLLTALVVSSLKENVVEPSLRQMAQKEDLVNLELLSSMARLSFRELVSLLTNSQPAEEGYLKRDLALASLVAFHDFNLEKALSNSLIQRRTLLFPPNQQIEVFPGLTDEQFQAVIKFAYEEKWPLTSKGLFRRLKQEKDESLVQAFLVTPEFYTLQRLFQLQQPSRLIDLVCEGSWDLLDQFYREQEQVLDVSDEKRTQFLLSYLALHSRTAAHLLLETDFQFAVKKLSDAAVLELMRLLDPNTSEMQRYYLELLRSPRTDAVLQRAAEGLYLFRKEPVPEPFDLRAAVAHFGSALQATSSPPRSTYRFHTVKEGENLWKIARQYGLKLDELVQLNELEKEQIFPGMTLRIP